VPSSGEYLHKPSSSFDKQEKNKFFLRFSVILIHGYFVKNKKLHLLAMGKDDKRSKEFFFSKQNQRNFTVAQKTFFLLFE
jgi:phage replication-related protein YjqB (UPF0714/DUF867 family)